MKKKKNRNIAPSPSAEDDLFSLGIPLCAAADSSVAASASAGSAATTALSLSPLEQIQQLELATDAAAAAAIREDHDELSVRAVLNRAKYGAAARPLLHPIDACRAHTKSIMQIKQQRLERKAERNSALKHGSGTRTAASVHVAFKKRKKTAGGSLQATLESLQGGRQN